MRACVRACARARAACVCVCVFLSLSTHVVDLCVVDVVFDCLVDFYGGASLENRVHDADGDVDASHHVPTVQQLIGGEDFEGAGAVLGHTSQVFGCEPDKD